MKNKNNVLMFRTIMKCLLYVVIFIGFDILFTFIHELSHVIVGISYGYRVLDFIIIFGFSFLRFSSGEVIFESKFSSGDNIVFVLGESSNNLFLIIAGSLGSIIVSLIILFFAIKKKQLIITFCCYLNLLKELFYWYFGSLLRYGDPFDFICYFRTFNYNLYLSLITASIFIVCYLMVKSMYKIVVKKIDLVIYNKNEKIMVI